MKSKKLTTIMLSFCICLSILTGCGSSPKNDQTQQKATETQMAETEQDTSLEDGEYTANVKLEGGSGRASVDSDAKIKVTDGQAYATIVWSSSHYDYMLVDGEKYEPVNEDGNSVFEIPVDGFDYPMEVVADTVAMSTPHEIEYTLQFDSASIKEADK